MVYGIHAPTPLRGVDMRIEAAMRADRARLLGSWDGSTPLDQIAQRQKAKEAALAKA